MKTQKSVGWPVFSLSFTPSQDTLLVGGGGGATKAGVKNALVLFKIVDHQLHEQSEHLFSSDGDGCMSIALHPKDKCLVAGVNGSTQEIEQGTNLNCKSFVITNKKLRHVTSFQSFDSVDPAVYQKIARFSNDGKLLVTGASDGTLGVWKWPDCTPSFTKKETREIVDLSVDPTNGILGYIISNKLVLLDLQKGKPRAGLEQIKMGNQLYDFRAIRYGRKQSEGSLFVVLNEKSKKGSYIQKYNLELKLGWSKQSSQKPITSFAISPDGLLMAYGCSDLSVIVSSTNQMERIRQFSNAHGFPSTCLDFNIDASLVVSGSADSTLVVLPLGSEKSSSWIYILIAILIVLVGLLLPHVIDPQPQVAI
ncbi:quinon protein alcohol dehydrogenase-like superfamily [Gorgonomyces haynaldii]|nr:quinon protein alcohol dehydrogenase-like superfamily [Gorgonomyces haynaldii]